MAVIAKQTPIIPDDDNFSLNIDTPIATVERTLRIDQTIPAIVKDCFR